MFLVDRTIKQIVRQRLVRLEKHFQGDVAFYGGVIDPQFKRAFADFIELTAAKSKYKCNRLIFFLNTPGGSVEAAEKMVDIMRFHYPEIFFVVPDSAMSAGTILCMSGDRIYMDYSSALGPIDPQVWNGKAWVPALGYLDKVNEILEKAAAGNLSNAEYLILQSQDLAELSTYEQAHNLTVTLLKKWLVEYKFQNWTHHQTDPAKKGLPVTLAEKEERAEQIAVALGDNKYWHSHGRAIGPETLTSKIGLLINDYSNDTVMRPLVRSYNDFLIEHIAARGNYLI